jgi:quercetin dioxygenase-like cupin family protein
MNVLREADLKYIETPGANATTGIATASRGATEVSVIRQRQKAGGGNPPHTHDREEVMLVLAGSVRVSCGDASTTLGAGDALVIPAETLHQLANAGDSEAEWLLIAPAGVGFFHENGERADPVWAH